MANLRSNIRKERVESFVSSIFSIYSIIQGVLAGNIQTEMIWDTAGQERFRSMVPLFYRNANAALLVFDITNSVSFYNIKDWVLELKGNIEEPIIICVVGTKCDLQSQRCISKDEAIRFSNKIGANYYECSALNDKGIEQMFRNVALDLVKLTGELLCTKPLNACDGLSVDSSIEINTVDCGTVIFPSSSKENIAHGTTVKSYCCFN